MNIAIIGTRGIPNHYGGFEQFAEYMSVGLVERGFRVTVYNSHTHPYQETTWRGVDIVHCQDPEEKVGTAGQFIYDLNCIRDTRKKNFDIILQLGYTSSSVWGRLLPRKKSIVTTNMDGLEWKRTKYSAKVQRFLKHAEKLGVKHSDYLIADSIGIQNYLSEQYNKPSVYIPYGANLFYNPDPQKLKSYGLNNLGYNMLVARLEPENSIEMILDGVAASKSTLPFLVIGKHETQYGDYLKHKFESDKRIQFLGGIYDIMVLDNLRHYSNLYFHGHTVGGTNPSLLEAMSSQALVCAHDNIFNRSILGPDAFYFSEAGCVQKIIDQELKLQQQEKVRNNEHKIEKLYSWDTIVNQYVEHFEFIMEQRREKGR